MKIKYFTVITLTKATNFAYFNLINTINNCLVKDKALGSKFQKFQTAFTQAFEKLDDVMKISRKSIVTPELTALDEQQVNIWRVIRASARDQQRLPEPEIANAANFITSIIKNHGDMGHLKMSDRSGAMINLVQDVTGKYADLVAKLGLTNFAQQLAEVNALFQEKYEQRLHEWSEFTDGEVKAARAACDDALENLLILVAGAILCDGPAPYKHFTDYVNEAFKIARISMGAGTQKPEGSVTEEEEVEEEVTEEEEDVDPTPPTNPQPGENGGENQQPGDNENGGNQPGGGTTNPPSGDQNGGGTTNTPSGPNTDAWGDGDEGDGSDV